ncbi:MAG: cytochrome-c oxidase, cbb3-type subunit III [Gammaproteobacteria bacterium]|jgi:cytochrome c oxidase cbb3-type subunit III|nr:cytochrome-c oxidase, cbb3-type subunit III [Gammaproteobacteria bacterium]MBT4491898.1 cytochrome-c oxidase, cbb3-type subunit III [Gammaproteobacteria bacterium]MBT7370496.1 cytochrome-c oxidase, cbb3-type subunit III [Gammaproteobacteria bacterium]
MSTAFSIFVIAGTILSMVGFFLLLHLNRKITGSGETTGHDWDGIQEFDNPLPVWWYWWFVLTLVFGAVYLVYYPGLGNFMGLGNWTQFSQLEESQKIADEKYGPIYAQYRDKSLDELGADPNALNMGRRIFASNCTVCHGARGEGSYGFPNLTDNEWTWGREDADIETTILHGRSASMAPWEQVIGEEGVSQVTEYVLKIAGREVDEAMAGKGKNQFDMFCVACHGPEGKGQKLFGAPDLTNEIWLYGNSRARIADVIGKGRNGIMPAFGERLGEDKVHILAGYIKSLSSE